VPLLMRQGKLLLVCTGGGAGGLGPWPVGIPEQLLADLQAPGWPPTMLGHRACCALAEREGLGVVRGLLAHVQDNAPRRLRQVDLIASTRVQIPPARPDSGLMS